MDLAGRRIQQDFEDKSKLRSIVVANVDSADEVGAEFSDGTLTVAIDCAQGAAGTPGWPEIERVLSAGL